MLFHFAALSLPDATLFFLVKIGNTHCWPEIGPLVYPFHISQRRKGIDERSLTPGPRDDDGLCFYLFSLKNHAAIGFCFKGKKTEKQNNSAHRLKDRILIVSPVDNFIRRDWCGFNKGEFGEFLPFSPPCYGPAKRISLAHQPSTFPPCCLPILCRLSPDRVMIGSPRPPRTTAFSSIPSSAFRDRLDAARQLIRRGAGAPRALSALLIIIFCQHIDAIKFMPS